jgi:hypothetical protein
MLNKQFKVNVEKAPNPRKLLKPVPKSQANMEAEKGESVLLKDKLGNPAHYKVGGKKHTEGGTPLNLPEGAFIYSDTADMRIKDKEILKDFGIGGNKRKGYTPAYIAKKYDINKFRAVFADPKSDKLQRETAGRMIENYEHKLAKLALVQEAMKGFPQGIPKVAQEYVGAGEQGEGGFEYQMGGAIDETLFTNDNLFSGTNMTPNWIPKENQQIRAPGNCSEEDMMNPASPCFNPAGVTKTTVDTKYGMGYGGPQVAGTILAGMDLLTGVINMGQQRKQLPQLRRMLSSTFQYPTKTRSDRGNYDVNSGNFKEYLQGYQPGINRKGGEMKYQKGGSMKGTRYIPQGEYPTYKNEDGSYSNEVSVGFSDQNGSWLIPSFFDGQHHDTETAIKRFYKTGEHLGRFANDADAEKGAVERERLNNENSLEKYSNYFQQGGEVEHLYAQDGGEVPVVIERKPGQTDEQFAAEWKAYKKAHPTEKVTVKDGDVVRMVTPKRLAPLTDTEKYVGEKISQNLQDSYGYTNRVLSDPDLQTAWYEKWKKNLQASTVPSVAAQRDKILKKYDSPAKVKDLFMKAQEQVYAIASTQGSDKDIYKQLSSPEGTKWDRGYGRNKMYKETMGTLGLDALPEEDIAAFQAAYYGLVDLKDEGHPEVSRLNIRARGKDDDSGRRGTKPISNVDAIFGNTTAGQMVTPGDADFELADIPATPAPDAPPASPELAPPALEAPVLDDTDEGFFLQDVVGLGGNLMDWAGIRKRLPWRNRVEPYLPQPVPYSPQSEIAANLAGGSEIISGLSSYAGPQSLSARASSVQGNLAQQNAQVLGKYSNLNVGVFNQFEGQKADILNNAAFYNVDAMTKMYDDNVLSNERYDQDKRTARSAVISRIASMYGNRADAHNLNMVNPHYQIDPTRAGSMYFKRGSKMIPGKMNPTNPIELYDQYRTNPAYSHIPDDVLLKLITEK